MIEGIAKRIGRLFHSYILWAFLGVIGGILLLYFNPLAIKPKVGIITISGTIFAQQEADDIVKMLKYAGEQRDIKAVVLDIDSPGGGASVVEEVYLNVLKLKKEKPVVAVIGRRGASGGYYIAAGANYIYTKPTSFMGSVGVIMTLGEPEELEEDVVTSGPFKASGGSRRDYVSKLEIAKETFLRAVMSQRGDRLKMSKEDLAKAEIYLGLEGLRLGLVDEIGSTTDAIEKAARMAGVRNYGEIDLREELNLNSSIFFFSALPRDSVDLKALQQPRDMLPKLYYLYIEPK